MSLKVVCFSSFLTETGTSWRPEDYDANKFVKALKGERIKGYANVPVNGVLQLLEQRNLNSAVDWFASMVRAYLIGQKIRPPLVFVPVPNSSHTIGSAKESRTLRLAQAICDRMGSKARAVDRLWWKKDLGSARKGIGTRDSEILYRNLALRAKSPINRGRVVLVDDVMTSGGHLRACARKIREGGAQVILAVCGGRTTHDQERGAFDLIEEMLDD